GADLATAIADERDTHGPYRSAAALAGRTGLTVRQMAALATAGAPDALGPGGRRAALWSAAPAARATPRLLAGLAQAAAPPPPGGSTPWARPAGGRRCGRPPPRPARNPGCCPDPARSTPRHCPG